MKVKPERREKMIVPRKRGFRRWLDPKEEKNTDKPKRREKMIVPRKRHKK